MSRSYRKRPIFGWTKRGNKIGEKKEKQRANRRFRLKTRMALVAQRVLPTSLRQISNIWTWAKDGKMYWANATDQDMRK
jgi:hypothetical protein